MQKGLTIDQLYVGQFAESETLVRGDDVAAFAKITGDDNPLHTDVAYAATTEFGKPIAHGVLIGGYVSALIAKKLPGYGTIMFDVYIRCWRPVKFGEVVKTRAEITAINPAKGRMPPTVTMSHICSVNGKKVTEGTATIIPPR